MTRNITAQKVRNGLRSFDQNSELLKFYSLLDDWVANETAYSGVIKLENPEKDLVYQLDKLEFTVVKLSEPNTYLDKDKVDTPKTGRNEKCNCGSGIKYKKCCFKVTG